MGEFIKKTREDFDLKSNLERGIADLLSGAGNVNAEEIYGDLIELLKKSSNNIKAPVRVVFGKALPEALVGTGAGLKELNELAKEMKPTVVVTVKIPSNPKLRKMRIIQSAMLYLAFVKFDLRRDSNIDIPVNLKKIRQLISKRRRFFAQGAGLSPVEPYIKLCISVEYGKGLYGPKAEGFTIVEIGKRCHVIYDAYGEGKDKK